MPPPAPHHTGIDTGITASPSTCWSPLSTPRTRKPRRQRSLVDERESIAKAIALAAAKFGITDRRTSSYGVTGGGGSPYRSSVPNGGITSSGLSYRSSVPNYSGGSGATYRSIGASYTGGASTYSSNLPKDSVDSCSGVVTRGSTTYVPNGDTGSEDVTNGSTPYCSSAEYTSRLRDKYPPPPELEEEGVTTRLQLGNTDNGGGRDAQGEIVASSTSLDSGVATATEDEVAAG